MRYSDTERNLKAKGADSKPQTASSIIEASEYVTSLQDANHPGANGDAHSGTGQEVELEQRTDPKQSETMEVEDIVSADTNNQDKSPMI